MMAASTPNFRKSRAGPTMKIAVVHMDLSLHWPARLAKLQELVACKGGEITIIEAATRGSPYDFARSDRPDAAPSQRLGIAVRQRKTLPPLAASDRRGSVANPRPDRSRRGAERPGRVSHRCHGRALVPHPSSRRGRNRQCPPGRRAAEPVRSTPSSVACTATSTPCSCRPRRTFPLASTSASRGSSVLRRQRGRQRVVRADAETHRRSGNRYVRDMRLPDRYFLGVGRHVAKKNWPCLISAYDMYRRTADRPWNLLLVGNGEDRGATLTIASGRWEAKASTSAVGLARGTLHPCTPPRVAWCFPVITVKRGARWSTRRWPAGFPILVSSECGCSQTLVRPGENGWQFSPHRPAEIAALMQRMATPSARRSRGPSERLPNRSSASGRWIDLPRGRGRRWRRCAIATRDSQGRWIGALFSLWHGRFRPV